MKIIDQFICGNALAELRKLPAESIDMCLTSPPYWGLRDYGIEQIFGGDLDCDHKWGPNLIQKKRGTAAGLTAQVGNQKKEIQGTHINQGNICRSCGAWKGQLGLEPTPELYIEHLTEIFNEVKRVLKKEGTLWLNIGDTYWGGKGKSGYPLPNEEDERYRQGKTLQHGYQVPGYMEMRPADGKHDFIQPKCLCMIPERLAWSLIQNGWILRNKIIWYKPNAMPSSVADRFSNRWEYIFMFSKSQRYYFDLDAVREAHAYPETFGTRPDKGKCGDKLYGMQPGDRTGNPLGKNPGDVIKVGVETRTMGAIIGSGGGVKVPGGKGWTGHPRGRGAACQKDPRWCPPGGKNPGDFFEINTQPFPEAHFAVFPEKLCEKPIKAGCPKEVCKKCGKATERIIELGEVVMTGGSDKGKLAQNKDKIKLANIKCKKMIQREHKTIGWTSCDCNSGFEPGVVLDPFAGAGTVGVMAKSLGRRFILIEIKEEYINMAKRRVAQAGHQMELFE